MAFKPLIADLRHFLDENGDTVTAPRSAYNLADFLTCLVENATSKEPEKVVGTHVPCRRMPNHRECTGSLVIRVHKKPSHIEWICPVCQDRGELYGWENTRWDKRPNPTNLVM